MSERSIDQLNLASEDFKIEDLFDGVLEFRLTLKEIKLTADGRDFVIVELTGAERDQYMNEIKRGIERVDGQDRFKSFEGQHSRLLKLCMYEELAGERKLVDEKTLQAFPGPVLEKINSVAMRLSALDSGKKKPVESKENAASGSSSPTS